MATRKREEATELAEDAALLFLFPLVVWFVAFLLWFYWRDLQRLVQQGRQRRQILPAGSKPRERSDTAPAKRPQEKILEEDRRKLDEILKRRG